MARPIEKRDAQKIRNLHEKLLTDLKKACAEEEKHRQGILEASDGLVQQELERMLKKIPVEELNREKRGFRIKTLREQNYETVGDIVAAPVYTIAAIQGISEEGARAIKEAAREIADATRQGVKIRLSMDDKTPAATRLVEAICKYRPKAQHLTACAQLCERTEGEIRGAIKELRPATGGLRWLFSSADKKNKAVRAFETLTAHMAGSYGVEATENLQALQALKIRFGTDAWKDFSDHSIQYFQILETINPGILGSDEGIYGLPEELARAIAEQPFYPEGLRCQLRRYQQWGVKYALHQQKVLLGDEMGLGKTVQAIASMVSLRNEGYTHFAVVCPASVLSNWCREIRKMSDLAVTKIHGADRNEALRHWLHTGGVAVTTYETTGIFQLEENFRFAMLVVDEAHYIKNPEAQRTKNVKTMANHAERLLFMTGTALENKVDEMVELIRILQPAVADAVRGMEFLASAPQFREKIAPVYYRRKRDDVLTELPELVQSREWCQLTGEEESLYEAAILARRYAEARRVSWNIPNPTRASKAVRMMELVEEAREEGRKVIVFSFFLDTIRKVHGLMGKRCFGPITGAIAPQRRQEIIDAFDKAPAGSVLAAQIQAGGTGLNIQSASVVIICEPQFKPSIENQAISRAYRMGQTRNVLVYRLLSDDTIDEKITDLLESKQAVFDAFADESVVAAESMELDETTFGNLIQEEIDRIQTKREN